MSHSDFVVPPVGKWIPALFSLWDGPLSLAWETRFCYLLLAPVQTQLIVCVMIQASHFPHHLACLTFGYFIASDSCSALSCPRPYYAVATHFHLSPSLYLNSMKEVLVECLCLFPNSCAEISALWDSLGSGVYRGGCHAIGDHMTAISVFKRRFQRSSLDPFALWG